MRIGLLGFGKWAQILIKVLLFLPNIKISCIYSRTKKQSVLNYVNKKNFFNNWKNLIASKNFDALIIALPPQLNIKIFNSIKKKNIPVLFEKPLSTKTSEISQITNFCRKSKNAKMFVNYIDLHNYELKNITKKISKFDTAEAMITSYAEPKSYVSSLWEYLPHFIAYFIRLTGDSNPKIVFIKKKIFSRNKILYTIKLIFKRKQKLFTVNIKSGWYKKKVRRIIFKKNKKILSIFNGNKITRDNDFQNKNIYNPLFNSLKNFISNSKKGLKNIDDIELTSNVTALIKKIEKLKR